MIRENNRLEYSNMQGERSCRQEKSADRQPICMVALWGIMIGLVLPIILLGAGSMINSGRGSAVTLIMGVMAGSIGSILGFIGVPINVV